MPRKIDYWYYLEFKNNSRDQIEYLHEEIRKKDEIIARFTNPVTEVREIVSPSVNTPVGKKNSVRVLAEMEAKDRENYWKNEIARRESESNSNVMEASDVQKES